MMSANKIKIKTPKNIKIYETIKPTKLTSTNAKLYERRTLTLAKDKRMDIQMAGMWVSRPGLGLETDQDHFFEVLVLVLVSEGGLEQDLRLCATATLLVSKVETSK